MIKILTCEHLGNSRLLLEFSDGVKGIFDVKAYLDTHNGPLLKPLADEDYVRRGFIEAGGLTWPNGLSLSPARLHEPALLEAVA